MWKLQKPWPKRHFAELYDPGVDVFVPLWQSRSRLWLRFHLWNIRRTRPETREDRVRVVTRPGGLGVYAWNPYIGFFAREAGTSWYAHENWNQQAPSDEALAEGERTLVKERVH